jgi:hypothetical protein
MNVKLLPLFFLLFSASCTGIKRQQAPATDTVAAVQCSDTNAFNRIKNTLSVLNVLDMTAEEFAEMNQDTPLIGLQAYDLDTTYDEHCVLSVTVKVDWTAAYPTYYEYYYNFDKRNGLRLRMSDVVKADSLNGLIRRCNELLADNISTQKADITEPDRLEDFNNILKETPPVFTPENIDNYVLTRDGMKIEYKFGFPRYALVLEPEGTLEFSIADISPYLKPDGPLGVWLKR